MNNTDKLERLSNWDLTNTYITMLWDCRMNVVETNEEERMRMYYQHMHYLESIRDELMKRLNCNTSNA